MIGLCVVLLSIVLATDAAVEAFEVPFFGDDIRGKAEVTSKGETVELEFHLDGDLDKVTYAISPRSALWTSNGSCVGINRQQAGADLSPRLSSNGSDVFGATIVLLRNEEPVACSTVVPPGTLREAIFDGEGVSGKVYAVALGGAIKLVPHLTVTDSARIAVDSTLGWAVVDACRGGHVLAASNVSDAELLLTHPIGVLHALQGNVSESIYVKLLNGGTEIGCEQLMPVQRMKARAGASSFEQEHAFVPTRVVSGSADGLSVVNDCPEEAEENVAKALLQADDHVLNLPLLGYDSQLLKGIVSSAGKKRICSQLVPDNDGRTASADIMFPFVGSVKILSGDSLIVSTSLRNLFDSSPSSATITLSPNYASSFGCTDHEASCDGCVAMPQTADILSPDGHTGGFSRSALPSSSHNLNVYRSIRVDAQWAKYCANLTHHNSPWLIAVAELRRYSVASARRLVKVEVREHLFDKISVVEHYTDAESTTDIDEISLYNREVDVSITSAPPCSEAVIGTKQNAAWINDFQKGIAMDKQKSRLLTRLSLLTGEKSFLGSTLLVKTKAGEYICGTIKLVADHDTGTAIAGSIFGGDVTGFIRLSQVFAQGNVTIMPGTELSYILKANSTSDRPTGSQHSLNLVDWEIVNAPTTSSCSGALVYDPFRVQDMNCSSDKALCPVGALSKRHGPLTLGSKRHDVIWGLSLAGSHSVASHYIRLRMPNKKDVCAQLERWHEIRFRYLSLNHLSLAETQALLSERLGVQSSQVAIHYNRELYKDFCWILDVTLSGTDEQVERQKASFDHSKHRFFDDDMIDCTTNTTVPVERKAHGTKVDTVVPTSGGMICSSVANAFIVGLILSCMQAI